MLDAIVVDQPEPLVRAMREDPPFVVWAIHQAAAEGQMSLPTLAQTAAWLLQGGFARQLAEPACRAMGLAEEDLWQSAAPGTNVPKNHPLEKGPASEVPPTLVRHWADLAAESIVVAELAVQLAKSFPDQRWPDPPNLEKTLLLGLLHKAPVWLEIGLWDGHWPEGSEGDPSVWKDPGDQGSFGARKGYGPQQDFMPSWLPKALADQGKRTEAGSQEGYYVAKATRLLAKDPAAAEDVTEDAGLGQEDLALGEMARSQIEQLLQRRDELSETWLTDDPGVPQHWRGLIRQHARLRLLEREFGTVLQTEKMAALAQFAAGAGHEINNPLATIAARAELLARGEPHPQRRADLAIIHTQAMRVHEMIAAVMMFARPPHPQLQVVNLTDLVGQTVEWLSLQAAERRIALSWNPPADPCWVEGDPKQLQLVVAALAQNAFEAIHEAGRLEFFVVVGAEESQIVVRDSGPGLGPEDRRHLFDPFYSGRQAGRGQGLGLSKCWAIVQAHRGRIQVSSQPGQTTIEVCLPTFHAEVAASSATMPYPP